MPRTRLTNRIAKKFSITERLDRIASELEQVDPKIAWAIDQVSDILEGRVATENTYSKLNNIALNLRRKNHFVGVYFDKNILDKKDERIENIKKCFELSSDLIDLCESLGTGPWRVDGDPEIKKTKELKKIDEFKKLNLKNVIQKAEEELKKLKGAEIYDDLEGFVNSFKKAVGSLPS